MAYNMYDLHWEALTRSEYVPLEFCIITLMLSGLHRFPKSWSQNKKQNTPVETSWFINKKYPHINNNSSMNKGDGKGVQEEGDKGTRVIREWKNGCEGEERRAHMMIGH
jgi:hypothetical protein